MLTQRFDAGGEQLLGRKIHSGLLIHHFEEDVEKSGAGIEDIELASSADGIDTVVQQQRGRAQTLLRRIQEGLLQTGGFQSIAIHLAQHRFVESPRLVLESDNCCSAAASARLCPSALHCQLPALHSINNNLKTLKSN